MKIIKTVQVKRVITEESKAELKENFHQRKMQLEQECQQLLFEQRKLKNKLNARQEDVNDRFAKEIAERKEKIALLDFKLEQLDLVQIGSEMVEEEVEALVEVKEGMSWDEIKYPRSIVIKDGYVIKVDEK